MSAGAPDRTTHVQRRRYVELAARDGLATERLPYTVDESFDLPFLAGYSKDGKTIFIDRHLAQAAPMIDQLPYSTWMMALVEHELSEKEAIDEGMTYQQAHIKVATPREHLVLKALRADPNEYEKELRPYIKAAEHERITKPPKSLDCTPYKGNDALSKQILAHFKKCGVKDCVNEEIT